MMRLSIKCFGELTDKISERYEAELFIHCPQEKGAKMSCRMIVLILIACSCFFSQGCTYRAWYDGFQERQRQECYQNRGHDEVQKCLYPVNSITYDEYEKGREIFKRQSN
jgi:hypothetical protein